MFSSIARPTERAPTLPCTLHLFIHIKIDQVCFQFGQIKILFTWIRMLFHHFKSFTLAQTRQATFPQSMPCVWHEWQNEASRKYGNFYLWNKLFTAIASEWRKLTTLNVHFFSPLHVVFRNGNSSTSPTLGHTLPPAQSLFLLGRLKKDSFSYFQSSRKIPKFTIWILYRKR